MTARPDRRDSALAALTRRDCQAAAAALLRATELNGIVLDELSMERYSQLRLENPHLGFPRATTISRVCGSWVEALEQAAALASASAGEG